MTEGYRVDLTQLQDYIDALRESQQTYDQIEDQLVEADLTTADPDFSTLVGHPRYGGAQAEFTEACRGFLTTYQGLYTQVHDVNRQISGKLNYMVQAFLDTHKLYQETEAAHASMFDGLLDGLTSGGGVDGAAGIR
jgi:hypothetical protein